MLAEMRRTLNDAAALLPAPVVAAPEWTEVAAHSVLDRLSDLWGSSRHARYEAAQRLMPASSSAEQVGGAAGAASGLGAAAKVVAACIVAGGTAVLCLERLEPDPSPPAHGRARSRSSPRP